MTSLDISNNNLGGIPSWMDAPRKGLKAGDKVDGKTVLETGSGGSRIRIQDLTGIIAIAGAIPTMGALETITFGDKQAATMKTDMTEADLSGKELGASGAIIVAAFLLKCQ